MLSHAVIYRAGAAADACEDPVLCDPIACEPSSCDLSLLCVCLVIIASTLFASVNSNVIVIAIVILINTNNKQVICITIIIISSSSSTYRVFVICRSMQLRPLRGPRKLGCGQMGSTLINGGAAKLMDSDRLDWGKRYALAQQLRT